MPLHSATNFIIMKIILLTVFIHKITKTRGSPCPLTNNKGEDYSGILVSTNVTCYKIFLGISPDSTSTNMTSEMTLALNSSEAEKFCSDLPGGEWGLAPITSLSLLNEILELAVTNNTDPALLENFWVSSDDSSDNNITGDCYLWSQTFADETIPADINGSYFLMKFDAATLTCGELHGFICSTPKTLDDIYDVRTHVSNMDENQVQLVRDCKTTYALSLRNPIQSINVNPNGQLLNHSYFIAKQHYTNGCYVNIVNQYPGTMVIFEFSDFNLPYSKNCKTSYLEIITNIEAPKDLKAQKNKTILQIEEFDRLNQLSDVFTHPNEVRQLGSNIEGTRICGDWQSAIKLLRFVGRDPGMQYSIHYVVRSSTMGNPPDYKITLKVYLDLSKLRPAHFGAPKSIALTAPSGQFSDLYYPSTKTYPNNLNKEIRIVMPYMYRVEIVIQTIDLEYQDLCLYDSLTVQVPVINASVDNDHPIFRLCGYYDSNSFDRNTDQTPRRIPLNIRNAFVGDVTIVTGTFKLIETVSSSLNGAILPLLQNSIPNLILTSVKPLKFVTSGPELTLILNSDHNNNSGRGLLFKWRGVGMSPCVEQIIPVYPPSTGINANSQIQTPSTDPIKSFSRLDLPYLTCQTKFAITNLTQKFININQSSIVSVQNANAKILLNFDSIVFDTANVHASCFEEYFEIMFGDDNNASGTQTISENSNISQTNINSNPENAIRNFIICPADLRMNSWNFRKFSSYTSAQSISVRYHKNSVYNYIKNYALSYQYIRNEIIILTNITVQPAPLYMENTYVTLNFPNPIPTGTRQILYFKTNQKSNIRIYGKTVLVPAATDNDCMTHLVVRDPFLAPLDPQTIPSTSNQQIALPQTYCIPSPTKQHLLKKSIQKIKRKTAPANMAPHYFNNTIKLENPTLPMLIAQSHLHVLQIEIITKSFDAKLFNLVEKENNLTPGFLLTWDLVKDDQFDDKMGMLSRDQLYTNEWDYCSNGGNFSPYNGCTCVPPYTGPMCLENPCDTKNCNFGVCVITGPTFRCECDKHHAGPECQYDVCESRHCNERGICYNLLHPITDLLFNQSCICNSGYGGDRCELTLPIIRNLSPSEKFFQEPFWMGIFLVIIVLILLGLIMLCQRKWAGEYKLVFCDDCFSNQKERLYRERLRRQSRPPSRFSSIDTILTTFQKPKAAGPANSTKRSSFSPPSNSIFPPELLAKKRSSLAIMTSPFRNQLASRARSNSKRRGSSPPLKNERRRSSSPFQTGTGLRVSSSPGRRRLNLTSKSNPGSNFSLAEYVDHRRASELYREMSKISEIEEPAMDGLQLSNGSNNRIFQSIKKSSNGIKPGFLPENNPSSNKLHSRPPSIHEKVSPRRGSSLLRRASISRSTEDFARLLQQHAAKSARQKYKSKKVGGGYSKTRKNLLTAYSSTFMEPISDSAPEFSSDDNSSFKTSSPGPLYRSGTMELPSKGDAKTKPSPNSRKISDPEMPKATFLNLTTHGNKFLGNNTVRIRDSPPPFIKALRCPLNFEPFNPPVISHTFGLASSSVRVKKAGKKRRGSARKRHNSTETNREELF